MLWSLIKILVFVAAIGALALGAGHLMELEGGLRVTFGGMEYSFSPLQTVIAGLVLILLVWVLLKLLSLLVATLKFLNGDDTAISRYFDRGRERKGYQALADGMLALASGDSRQALTKAAKAEKYLQKPELTQLLSAQAAEQSGDTKKATEAYKALIKDDRSRFVGVRGILNQKLAEGDADTARKLAEKAFELKPHHEEIQDTLLRLQAGARDWSGARATLGAKLKSGTLPRDVYTRREAVLALSEATDIVDENASVDAREEAIQANRLSPDLIPAAALAARSYIEQGRPKNAARILRKAWQTQPHPDLAAAFAEIAPDETPAERLKRFEQLTNVHPDNPETRLVRAELLIVAEQFPDAARVLSGLIEANPDARALTLMAAVERGQGATDSVVQGWLTRALGAPRGPQWICDNCNHGHGAWQPVCDSCDAFDTLSWRTPASPDMPGTTGAQMLPLIVSPQTAEDSASPDDTLPAVEVLDAEEVTDTKPGDTLH